MTMRLWYARAMPRPKTRGARWAPVALLLVLGGCGQEPSPSAPAPAPSAPSSDVVREWSPRPMKATDAPSRALGEPCEQHGASECVSGLCARTATGARLCSRECKTTSECPESWTCVAAMPGGSERLCLPRPDAR